MRAATPAFARLLAHSHRRVTTVDAYYNGHLTLAGVPIVDGQLDFDDSAIIKRSLTLTVPARTPLLRLDPGADPLAPLANYGQRLRVRTGMLMPGGAVEQLDMGWYLIVDWKRDEAGGTLTVNATDLAQLLTDSRLYVPQSPPVGATFASEARRLADGILPVTVLPGLADRPISTATVWDRDRDGALTALCEAWPARWYVDDLGTLTFAPPYPPVTTATTPDVIVSDGAGGVIVERGRDSDRGRHYNAVVVNGATAEDGAAGPHAVAEITDPNSPIRATGPFGHKPRFFASDLITTTGQAQAAAVTMLARYETYGRAETLEIVPDPRVQLGDVARAFTSDGDRYTGRVTGQTLPLTAREGPMQVTISTLPPEDPTIRKEPA